ncbi:Smr/MutS family protein [Geopsychrobacter electrodiphilus]|uniref:Smr/MutS family protein n=1 Tax=Geopsychrobacter electrodiphilus TaxID=225196 RepID=UPI0003639A28|nr:Smr/MutS family protein [Geopsychrobacter electrodiphilus]
MTKKKSSSNRKTISFDSNPFKQLKGFAVSAPAPVKPSAPAEPEPSVPPDPEIERSFFEEMKFLGVDPLAKGHKIVSDPASVEQIRTQVSEPPQSEEEYFLAALGPLDVCFEDQPPSAIKPAVPRRLKQLKQGRLTPDASLDLHGLQRQQVAEKIEFFLQNALYQQWQTLIVVTGRGLHSAEGQTVLRDEAERYLCDTGKRWVAEWCRAPRQYGGEGALVLFLKNNDSGAKSDGN